MSIQNFQNQQTLLISLRQTSQKDNNPHVLRSEFEMLLLIFISTMNIFIDALKNDNKLQEQD